MCAECGITCVIYNVVYLQCVRGGYALRCVCVGYVFSMICVSGGL